jgi:hypothetical protein
VRRADGGPETISEEAEALRCLELLYRSDVLQDPRAYVCKGAAGYDQAAAEIEDLDERRRDFSLLPSQCSFTYRNRPTTVNDGPTAPLAADKRGPSGTGAPTNHADGRNVAFVGGQVEFVPLERLRDATDPAVRRFGRELVGFGSR